MHMLRGRALGLLLVFLTAILWTAASFVSQLLVTNEEGRTNFHVPPFLLTYLSTSVFTVFLPLVQLRSLLQETWLKRRSFKYKPLQGEVELAPVPPDAAAGADVLTPNTCQAGGLTAVSDLELAEAAAAAEQASAAARAVGAAHGHKEAYAAATKCFLIWFSVQVLFNYSLKLTSVTSNTILSSTSTLFTFGLSMLFLQEPYSVVMLLSIAASIVGTVLVTLSDNSSDPSDTSSASPAAVLPGSSSNKAPSNSVWGDVLCLASAALYAWYTIMLRKALPNEDTAQVALFFGYVGLLSALVFAPVVALLAGVGAMRLKAIPSQAYSIIVAQGVLNYCLSDYLWAHAVILLGPTIASLGLSVQIPVAAVVEALIGHPKWLSSGAAMAMTLSGTALIMAGFVAGNLAGGGHVYGSRHPEDHEADALERWRPPGRLEHDSLPGNRHSATSPATRGAANGTSHSPQRNGVFRSSLDADSGSGEDDMPQSPLLFRVMHG